MPTTSTSPFEAAQRAFVAAMRTRFSARWRSALLSSVSNQLHHVIRPEIIVDRSSGGLIEAGPGARMLAWLFSEQGFNINDPTLNGLPLPANSADATATGRGLHNGRHVGSYDVAILTRLDDIADEFGDLFEDDATFQRLFATGSADGVDLSAVKQAAREAVYDLVQDTRYSLTYRPGLTDVTDPVEVRARLSGAVFLSYDDPTLMRAAAILNAAGESITTEQLAIEFNRGEIVGEVPSAFRSASDAIWGDAPEMRGYAPSAAQILRDLETIRRSREAGPNERRPNADEVRAAEARVGIDARLRAAAGALDHVAGNADLARLILTDPQTAAAVVGAQATIGAVAQDNLETALRATGFTAQHAADHATDILSRGTRVLGAVGAVYTVYDWGGTAYAAVRGDVRFERFQNPLSDWRPPPAFNGAGYLTAAVVQAATNGGANAAADEPPPNPQGVLDLGTLPHYDPEYLRLVNLPEGYRLEVRSGRPVVVNSTTGEAARVVLKTVEETGLPELHGGGRIEPMMIISVGAGNLIRIDLAEGSTGGTGAPMTDILGPEAAADPSMRTLVVQTNSAESTAEFLRRATDPAFLQELQNMSPEEALARYGVERADLRTDAAATDELQWASDQLDTLIVTASPSVPVTRLQRIVGLLRDTMDAAASAFREISFGQLGSIFGSNLARLIQTDDQWTSLGVGTTLAVIGANVGQAIDLARDGNVQGAFTEAFRDLPSELLDASAGAISSYLVGELIEDLGIEGELGGALNSTSGAAISQFINNIRHYGEWVNELGQTVEAGTAGATPRGLGYNINVSMMNALGAFVGTWLASELVQFDTIEGQIGASVGSAVGSAVGVATAIKMGAQIGSIWGPIGAAIGAFIGYILGGLIGSLFGGTPKAGAELGWDQAEQRFEVGRVWSKNGGSDGVRAMASQVGELLNSVVAASGARVLDASRIQTGAYDQKGGDFIYKVDMAGGYAFRTDDMQAVVLHGAFIALSGLSERLAGGDVHVKRALSYTLQQANGDPNDVSNYSAGDFEVQSLFGNIATAQDYASYLQNAAVINALIAAEPQSAFTAGWTITFARVMELGLDRRWKSDWVGGWAAFLDETADGVVDGGAFAPSNVFLDLDPETYERLFAFIDADGALLGVLGDTIDTASKTIIEGSASADSITLETDSWSETRTVTETVTIEQDRTFFNRQTNSNFQIAPEDVFNGEPIELGEGLVLVGEHTVEVTREVAIQRDGWRIEDASGLSMLNRDAEGGPAFEAMPSGPSGQVRVAAYIDGGAGNDTIRGGDLGNDLLGGEGNDTLVGGALDDWQFGGDGNDRLFAGDVADVDFSDTATDTTNENERNAALAIDGGNGDYLDGGAGEDALYGGRGSDWLNGGDGVDILRAGDGGDILDGGAGDDRGSGGEARIFGGAGSDQYVFYFGAGDDVIFDASSPSTVAGAGLYSAYARYNSLLTNPGARNWAGDGDYEVDGSVVGGEDAISFGPGVGFENLLLRRGTTSGAANADLIIELVDDQGDLTGDTLTIKDWFDDARRVEWLRFADGQDIRIGDVTSFIVGPTLGDSIIGTEGADWAVGLDNNDSIELLGGNDFGFGGKGKDVVSGDDHNDFLSGGDGIDQVLGKSGNDTVFGDAGNDAVDGGEGHDIIAGGRGNDTMIGGAGDDLYRFWRGDGADTLFDAYNSTTTEDMQDEEGNWINGYYEQDGFIYYNAEVLLDDEQWSAGLDWNTTTGRLTRRIHTQGQPITANAGFDKLEFGFGIDIEDVQVRRIGGDLVIAIGGGALHGVAFGAIGDSITLMEHFSAGAQIERFVFAEVGALDIATWSIAYGANNATSSDGDDTITGGAGTDWHTGGLGNDTISGAAGDDILSGNAGADELEGGDGADVIYGGGDDDTMTGGAGADQMFGGAGEDVASYATNTAGIRVSLEDQYVNTLEARGDLLVGIEGVAGGSGADKLYGDGFDNTLSGNAGHDVLKGSGGDDTYEVNANQGDDTIAESNISVTEIIDANGDLSAGYTMTWTLDDIEDLWGVYWYRYKLIVKDSANNTVYESNFNDFKYSGPVGEAPPASSWPFSNGQWVSGIYRTGNGVQTVQEIAGTGDAGHDTLELGAGISLSELTAEEINGGADLKISIAGCGTVTIVGQSDVNRRVEDLILSDGLTASLANLADAGTVADDLYLGDSGSNVFDGGDGDDTISGGGDADTLSGGAGDDTLEGGAGADALHGGADSVDEDHDALEGNTTGAYGDTIRYVNSNAGVLVDLGAQTASGGHAAGDTISGIENVVGAMGHNDTLLGSNGANRLSGLGGNDTIDGLGGDDVLIGGDGVDDIDGGAGADAISGDAGNDAIDAGAGDDIIAGGDGDDTILAGAGLDRALGGGGDDEIEGGADKDELLGGDGADVLHGDAGDDVLAGEAGVDELHGGDGADTLAGGEGNDTLRGDAGDDAYVFDLSSGSDVIVDASGTKNSIAIDGVSFEKIWMTKSADDLVIAVIGASTQITVKDYFLTSNQTLMRAIATSDHTLFLGSALPLINAMTEASATPPESVPSSVSDLFAMYWHLGEKSVPTVGDQDLATNEDVALTGAVGAEDHDGETMSYALTTGPQHGELSLNTATGAWTYAPDANWSGEDGFTIAVTDESGQSRSQRVDVAVAPVNDAPTITTTAFTIDEHLATSTVVGTLVSTDVEGQGVTYTQQANAGGRFAVSSTGVITVMDGGAINYEGASSYEITVTATDAGGATLGPRTITINLNDVNEAPTSLTLANAVSSLAENTSTSSRVKVADLIVGDDALGSETLTLSGADAASFEIFEGALYLKAGVALNFETKQSYAVTVTADDSTVGGSPDVSQNFTLAITDVNEAPTLLTLANAVPSLAEATSTAVRVKVADLVISDDALGSETLALAGADAASFEIVNGALYLKAGVALDYETKSSYSVTVTVDDTALGSGIELSQGFTLSITDGNEAPTGLSFANTTTAIAENASTATRTKVADIVVNDDALGTLVYGLTGADAAAFEIIGTELFLKAGVALNYESKASYAVTVTVDDPALGSSYELSQGLTLLVNDVNEAPTALTFSNTTTSIAESASTATRTKVADLSYSDDALGSETYALSGTDAASFEIIGTSLYLKAGVALNYEAKSSYSVNVTVDDSTIGSSAELSQLFTLSISDMNEAPTALGFTNSTTTLAENTSTASRIKVADIVLTDDALGSESLSLSGADATFFEIDGGVFYLKAGVSLDYEVKASYAVTVSADDATVGASPDVGQTFTLNISDVNEAPTALSFANTTTSLAENASTASRIKVADLSYGDDALGSESYGLSGADAASFEIIGQSLYLKAGVALNYEAKTSYAVTVTVDDASVGASPDLSQGFTLAITDVNEAPSALSLTNTVTTLAENTSTTSAVKIADLVLTDDALGTETWSLSGTDAGAFEIVGGALYLKAGTALNYEAKTAYNVTVSADDTGVGGTPDASQNFTLSVTNVNEAPVVTARTRNSNAGGTVGLSVGTSTVTDPDGAGAVTWSIVSVTGSGGAGMSSYSINATTGLLTCQYNTGGVRTSDFVTVRATDAGGLSSQAMVTLNYDNDQPWPPIVFDLDGDGMELVSAENSSVEFDVNGDGIGDDTGWVGGDDAFLALDRDGDGLITRGEEISFTHDADGAASDLEGLASYDTNGDGFVATDDADFATFRLWQDANQDGVAQTGELTTLAQRDIVAINLTMTLTGQRPENLTDNVLYGTASFVRSNGSLGTVGDVFLAYAPGEETGGLPPIVFDLDGGGVALTSRLASEVMFDADDDGITQRTGWFAAGEGVLALDRNGDGLIGSGSEISFAQDLEGARTDLEGLRAFDSNENGFFDETDARFADFRIWQDANQDGVSQTAELQTLAHWNVRAVNLTPTLTGASLENARDNVIYATAEFVRGDGTLGFVGDVYLSYDTPNGGEAGMGVWCPDDLLRPPIENTKYDEDDIVRTADGNRRPRRGTEPRAPFAWIDDSEIGFGDADNDWFALEPARKLWRNRGQRVRESLGVADEPMLSDLEDALAPSRTWDGADLGAGGASQLHRGLALADKRVLHMVNAMAAFDARSASDLARTARQRDPQVAAMLTSLPDLR